MGRPQSSRFWMRACGYHHHKHRNVAWRCSDQFVNMEHSILRFSALLACFHITSSRCKQLQFLVIVSWKLVNMHPKLVPQYKQIMDIHLISLLFKAEVPSDNLICSTFFGVEVVWRYLHGTSGGKLSLLSDKCQVAHLRANQPTYGTM